MRKGVAGRRRNGADQQLHPRSMHRVGALLRRGARLHRALHRAIGLHHLLADDGRHGLQIGIDLMPLTGLATTFVAGMPASPGW